MFLARARRHEIASLKDERDSYRLALLCIRERMEGLRAAEWLDEVEPFLAEIETTLRITFDDQP